MHIENAKNHGVKKQKSPIKKQKGPIKKQKRPIQNQKRPMPRIMVCFFLVVCWWSQTQCICKVKTQPPFSPWSKAFNNIIML